MKIFVEMAKTNREIAQGIFNQINVGIEHLLKLYLYSDIRPEDVHGWKLSVWNSLSSVPKSKTYKNKYPTANDIYKWTWECYGDCLEDQYDGKISIFEYLDPPFPSPNKGNAKDFLEKVNTYYRKLSLLMEESGVGIVKISQVSSLIDDIFDIRK